MKQTEGNDKYYLISPTISGADKSAKKELSIILEEFGFSLKEGGMGAGPADVYHEVVAFLSVHYLLSGLLINIASGYILKILDKLYQWYKRNYKDKKYRPSVNIYLYSIKKERSSIFVWFNINKKYSKKEVKEKIKKSLDLMKDH